MGLRTWGAAPMRDRRLAAVFAISTVVAIGFALSADRSVAQTAPRATIFVVDTSGSMRGARLATAKNALIDAAGAIPAGAQIGLRSFGGPCSEGGTELVRPGPFSPPTFSAAVESLAVVGVPGTPTDAALQAAAATLPPSGDRTLILISDGESSCSNPCNTASELAQQLGDGFRIDTVGFHAPLTAEAELDCIARVTGGTYVSVGDLKGLAQTLAESTAARVTGLRVSPSRFRAAARGRSISTVTRSKFGARVLYTIAAPRRVRFTVERVVVGRRVGGRCRLLERSNRRNPRCARVVVLPGAFTHNGKPGKNTLRFTGRLGGRKLKLGLYKLVATAIDAAGQTAKPARVAIRLVRN